MQTVEPSAVFENTLEPVFSGIQDPDSVFDMGFEPETDSDPETETDSTPAPDPDPESEPDSIPEQDPLPVQAVVPVNPCMPFQMFAREFQGTPELRLSDNMQLLGLVIRDESLTTRFFVKRLFGDPIYDYTACLRIGQSTPSSVSIHWNGDDAFIASDNSGTVTEVTDIYRSSYRDLLGEPPSQVRLVPSDDPPRQFIWDADGKLTYCITAKEIFYFEETIDNRITACSVDLPSAFTADNDTIVASCLIPGTDWLVVGTDHGKRLTCRPEVRYGPLYKLPCEIPIGFGNATRLVLTPDGANTYVQPCRDANWNHGITSCVVRVEYREHSLYYLNKYISAVQISTSYLVFVDSTLPSLLRWHPTNDLYFVHICSKSGTLYVFDDTDILVSMKVTGTNQVLLGWGFDSIDMNNGIEMVVYSTTHTESDCTTTRIFGAYLP